MNNQSLGTTPVTVSVVIETFTVTREYEVGLVSENPLWPVLDAVSSQTYPADKTEILVVFDSRGAELADYLQTHYPQVKLMTLPTGRYFSMKNAGIERAQGEIVALLDGDCIPSRQWLECIVASFARGAQVAVGKTRYRGDYPLAGLFSVFDFGHVQMGKDGETDSFVVNNVAFKRDLALAHPFSDQVRNGGCYHLARRLKARGYKMLYDPAQFVAHGYDIVGLGFIKKHLVRGFDSIKLLVADQEGVLAGARFAKLGFLTPFGMSASRLLFDLRRVVTNRDDLNVRLYALPVFYLASLVIRSIEMLGGLIAVVNPDYFSEEFGG